MEATGRLLPNAQAAAVRPEGIFWPAALLLFAGFAAASAWVLPLRAQQRAVALPIAVLGLLALILICALWQRDRVLPVFDVGAMCAIATAIYSMMPLVGYYLADFQWTILSDNRIYTLNPGPAEVGAFFWRHIVYLGAFVVVYLALRGRAFVATEPVAAPAPGTTFMLVFTAVIFTAYFWMVKIYTGVDFNATHEQLAMGMPLTTTLPYFIQQISHNFFFFPLLSKQWLIIILMRRWDTPKYRALLIVWLGAECVYTVVRMGQRSTLVFLLLTVALMYHRLVKPMTLRKSVTAVSIGLGALLAYGLFRDIYRHLDAIPDLGIPLASAATEFQILFGTSYDLYARKVAGILPTVPWTIYFHDILMLIPSQLLPFYKWDPAVWYLEVLGARNTGFGAGFGVISQAIVGFDWVELAVRGALLGFVFAKIHRWYVKNSRRFWVVAFYMSLVIWSYNSFRASEFSFLQFMIYSWLPAALIIWVGAALVRGASHRNNVPVTAPVSGAIAQ